MKEVTMNEYPPDDVQWQAFVYRYLEDWAAGVAGFIKSVDNMNQRHRARRQAEAVDYRVLRDIGVSEAQRFIEVNKTFWEK